MTHAEQRALAATKFKFLERIADDTANLPPLAAAVAIAISRECKLAHSGGAEVSQQQIADVLGVKREAVNRAIAALVARGHLNSVRRGRDNPNLYFMAVAPGSRCAQSRTSSPKPRPNRASRCAQNEGHDVRKRAHTFLKDSFKSPLGTATQSPRGRERERAARAEFPPLGGDPPACAGPPRQGSLPLAATPSPRRDRKESAAEERFREADALRARWARGHAKDETPKAIAIVHAAYLRARQIASAEEIAAGAEREIAAADALRFLPELAGWLDAKRWTKPPPTKPQRQHAGNGRACPRRESRQGRRRWARRGRPRERQDHRHHLEKRPIPPDRSWPIRISLQSGPG
jgi:hypothetical protein